MIDDDFLWNRYFESDQEESESKNGNFEKELKAKEEYYETKKPTKNK
ncbi:MAG: hypothetical protein QM660_10590 [Dysgonomonas sp.]